MNNIAIIADTREPWPHPWSPFFPPEVRLVRQGLPTGDFALAGAPDGFIVERKTVSDLLGVIGTNRERFERELLRARFVAGFCVVVEGSLNAVLQSSRGIHPSAIMGSIAAWARRGFPVLFADCAKHGAELAFRFLSQPLNEARQLLRVQELAAHEFRANDNTLR